MDVIKQMYENKETRVFIKMMLALRQQIILRERFNDTDNRVGR